MNTILVLNNVATAYTCRSDNNSCGSFNLFTQFADGDLLSFASDVAGAFIRNVVAYIRYIPLNTKIVNTVVDTGTSLELLSDTKIINKQKNDILIYDSTSSRWINKPSGFTPSYW